MSRQSHARPLVFGLLFFVASTERAAYAEDASVAPPEAPSSTPLASIEPAIGIGAPLGWLGVSAVVVPIEELGLHAGIGLGSHGVQLDAGARGRIRVGLRTFASIGAGWSTGTAAVGEATIPNWSLSRPSTWYWERAHLVNLDLSLEHATPGFGQARPFLGCGIIVNDPSALANAPCHGCAPSAFARLIPYVGVALAFGVL